MKILHVIRDLAPSTGGPVSALKVLASAQADTGNEVTVAATDYGLETVPDIRGADVRVYPCTSAAWRFSAAMGKGLSEQIERADIVHIHTLWEYPTWAAARISRTLKRPYILRPCGMLDEWSMTQRGLKKKLYLRGLLGNAFANAAAIHFTTEGELNKSIKVNCGGRFVVPIGVTLASGDMGQGGLKNRFPELQGKILILFLGRIHYKKQPDLLIRAFGNITEKFPEARLIIAGPADGEYLSELQHLVNGLGLQEKVAWPGFLDRQQTADAYRCADIFVLPSLQENFGISVAEAMAAGCPVIVSENVDLAADVLGASAGLVCRNDEKMLAADMARLLERPEERRRMGENGRQLVQDRFSPMSVARNLLEVYSDILTGGFSSKCWRDNPK